MEKTVLVVDDSPTVRALESFILQSAGFKVEAASNGIDALEKIYENSYSLIVTDINMPKMDGLTLTKTLREQDAYRDVPIIIVTSESEDDDRIKGTEAGANVYLVKPTKPEQLLANVKMLLAD